jgi:hypothetical protein
MEMQECCQLNRTGRIGLNLKECVLIKNTANVLELKDRHAFKVSIKKTTTGALKVQYCIVEHVIQQTKWQHIEPLLSGDFRIIL